MFPKFNFKLAFLNITVFTLIIFTAFYFLSKQTKSMSYSADNSAEQENYEFDSEKKIEQEFLMMRDPKTNSIPFRIKQKEREFYKNVVAKNLKKFSNNKNLDEWKSIGPNNLGGRTRAIGLDKRDENIINAGAATSGMFQSTNEGITWKRTSSILELPSVTCIIQDTRKDKEDNWYYGTGEYRSPSIRFGNVLYSGDGIFKSSDNGKTWEILPVTSTNKPNQNENSFDFVYNLAIDISNKIQTEIYAATYKGIRRSTDGGNTWVQVLGNDSTPACYSDVVVTSKGIVYATISAPSGIGGIYKSNDGIDWKKIQPQNFPELSKRFVINYAPSNENIIYVLGQTENYGAKIEGFYGFPEWYTVWKYNDSTNEWNDFSQNLPTEGYENYNSLNSYAMYLKVHKLNPDSVFVGGSNLYITASGFSNKDFKWLGGYSNNGAWQGENALHPDQHAIYLSDFYPGKIYCGNDGGIKRINYNITTDFSQKWEPLNTGYITSQFYSVSIDKSNQSELIAGGAQDNGSWLGSKITSYPEWYTILGGDGCFTEVLDTNSIYTSTQNGRIYKIDKDNGISFINKAGDGNYLFVNPFELPNTDELYTPVGNRIKYLNGLDQKNYFSDQENAPWQYLDNTTITDGQISALSITGNNLYYGTTNGKLYKLTNRTSLVDQPLDITGKIFPKDAYINCIATLEKNSDVAVAVFTNYNVQSVFATTDGGISWENISANLEENPDGSGNGPSCKWAKLMPLATNAYKIYLGTSIGLYSSTFAKNNYSLWKQEAENSIGNCIVDMIDFNDKFVVAATWGRGIFATQRQTNSIDNSHTSPILSHFKILCNEVHNEIKITYETKNNFILDYNIFNSNSELIKTGKLNPIISVADLPAGFYFISVKNDVQKFIKY